MHDICDPHLLTLFKLVFQVRTHSVLDYSRSVHTPMFKLRIQLGNQVKTHSKGPKVADSSTYGCDTLYTHANHRHGNYYQHSSMIIVCMAVILNTRVSHHYHCHGNNK